MTLSEIVTLCMQENGSRFQLQETQVVTFLDMIQKVAFNRDLDAFLIWDEYMTVHRKLTFASAGYTDAVASDVGKVVTDGSASGTLISYDNAEEEWVVELSGSTDFSDGAAVTITSGTGAGTLAASGAQTVHRGPYSVPTSPPCRKLLGVTQVTEAQIWGSESLYSLSSLFPLTDYGLRLTDYDPRKFFEAGRINAISQTFTFPADPVTAAKTYRWIYYRRAPTISGTDSANADNLLIPEEFHHTLLVQGVIALADNAVYGDKAPQAVLLPYLEPYWEMLIELTTGQGEGSLGLSEGQP